MGIVSDQDDALANQIIAIYNQRDSFQSVTQAAIAAGQYALDRNAQARATQPSGKITLQLEAPQQRVTSRIRIAGPATAGKPTTAQAQSQTTTVTTQIALDVVPNGDGFAQSVVYTRTANETTHQTAGGFTQDQWGEKPGDLIVEAIVVFNRDIGQQIQQFKDLLAQAKAASPLDMKPAVRVKYINAIDGQSFVISQTSLEIRQAASDPNMARVTIRAAVLFDYASPGLISSAPTIPINGSNPQLLLDSFVDPFSISSTNLG